MSTMELWDSQRHHVRRSFADLEAERTQGKAGVLISFAVNLGEDAILVGRNNQVVIWTLRR